MQTLYAYHVSEDKVVAKFEKMLLNSVQEVDQMYIWTLNLLDEVAEYVLVDVEGRTNKWLPTDKDKNLSSTKLNTNTFIESLRMNREYVEKVKKYKVAWDFDPEIVRSVYTQLSTTDVYLEYLASVDRSIAYEKDIIKHIFKRIILKSPAIEQAFEERFINWSVDKEVLQAMVAKTFKNFASENPNQNKLANLLPNTAEDTDFVVELFHRTIKSSREFLAVISENTKNWESERIALMDSLLMQMALAEFLYFPTIPINVTMNEYIELAKEYSTSKSGTFVNGILDKILADYRKQGRVRKEGRGLQA